MKILITGTTGWLGSELAKRLASSTSTVATDKEYQVYGLARRKTTIPNVTSIQADITSKSDMNELHEAHKEEPFDVIVHLAGAAGWCSLEDGININVSGTRNILTATRHPTKLQKFIVASSVAVTGTCSPNYPPKKLPIGLDDGFVGSEWAYGLSKSMVEDLVKFMSRSDATATATTISSTTGGAVTGDYMLIRIGGVVTDPPGPLKHLETALDEEIIIKPATCADEMKKEEILPEFPLLAIALSDMMKCLELAIFLPHQHNSPEARVITAVGPSAYAKDPVVKVMESWYGEKAKDIDMTYHRQEGHEYDPIYETESAKKELGFVAKIDLRQYL